MPTPEEEPVLFLALTTWRADELAMDRPLFPLVTTEKRPLSVRSVFQRCDYFSAPVDASNPASLKLNGDYLEILALAALTLASLRCDDGFLAGNSFYRFVATVSLLLSFSELTKDELDCRESHITQLFDGLDFPTSKVPAAANSDSSMHPDICGDAFARLNRPADAERRDGSMTAQGTGDPVIHIECKNYNGGIPTVVVEKVIARLRVNFKTSFLFTSKLKGLWSTEGDLDRFFNEMGLDREKLYILVVAKTGAPHWLESLSGHCFKPNPKNSDWHILVVFEATL